MKRMFGDSIMGLWFCPRYKCGYNISPDDLKDSQDKFKWAASAVSLRNGYTGPLCPICSTALEYEEYDDAA